MLEKSQNKKVKIIVKISKQYFFNKLVQKQDKISNKYTYIILQLFDKLSKAIYKKYQSSKSYK